MRKCATVEFRIQASDGPACENLCENRRIPPDFPDRFREADRESPEYLSIQDHIPVLLFDTNGRHTADIMIDNECHDMARYVL